MPFGVCVCLCVCLWEFVFECVNVCVCVCWVSGMLKRVKGAQHKKQQQKQQLDAQQ